MKKLLTILSALVLTLFLVHICNGNSICQDNFQPCTHTTQIGTCHNCGIFQNQSDYNTIKNNLSEASNLFEIALKYISSVSNNGSDYNQRLFNAIQNTQSQIENAKSCLNNAIAICDNYSELSTISSSIRRANKALPTNLSSSSNSDVQKYLDGMKTFITELTTARTQLAYIK